MITKNYIDTEKMKEAGNYIIATTKNFLVKVISLSERIKKINNETYEWQGNSADKFVEKVSKELNNLSYFVMMLNNLGQELLNEAENYENMIKTNEVKQ